MLILAWPWRTSPPSASPLHTLPELGSDWNLHRDRQRGGGGGWGLQMHCQRCGGRHDAAWAIYINNCQEQTRKWSALPHALGALIAPPPPLLTCADPSFSRGVLTSGLRDNGAWLPCRWVRGPLNPLCLCVFFFSLLFLKCTPLTPTQLLNNHVAPLLPPLPRLIVAIVVVVEKVSGAQVSCVPCT